MLKSNSTGGRVSHRSAGGSRCWREQVNVRSSRRSRRARSLLCKYPQEFSLCWSRCSRISTRIRSTKSNQCFRRWVKSLRFTSGTQRKLQMNGSCLAASRVQLPSTSIYGPPTATVWDPVNCLTRLTAITSGQLPYINISEAATTQTSANSSQTRIMFRSGTATILYKRGVMNLNMGGTK